jgi:hypothetical protein
VSETPDSKTDLETSMEDELLDRFEAKKPSVEEKQALREAHQHHLVRDTTSTLTVDPDEEMVGVEIESQVEIPDCYCFTCDEWVGLSGVDLTGTPRSKTDAYYLSGPPEDVQQAREETQTELRDLAYRAMRDVEQVNSVEGGFDFVATQLEQIRDDRGE